MYQVSAEQFEMFVRMGVQAIPEEFRNEMSNVAVTTAEWPTREQLVKLQLQPGHHTLFGLYEGVPLPKRGAHYSGVLPDKITIFRKPIEWAAHSEDDVRQQVINTVWHEFGHHFGLNEAEVRAAERRRAERSAGLIPQI